MPRIYRAIVRPAETGGYEAVMPGRPYDSADGGTREESITNLRNRLARHLVSLRPDYTNNPPDDSAKDRLPGVIYPPDLSDPRVQGLLNAMVITDNALVLSDEDAKWFGTLVGGLRIRPAMFIPCHRECSGYDLVVSYLLGFEYAQSHQETEPVLDLFQGLVQQRLGGAHNERWSSKIWSDAQEDNDRALTLLFDLLEEYVRGDWLEPGSTIVQFECPID